LAKVHWLALSSLPGVGAVTVHTLIDRFGTIEAVFDASDSELLTVRRVRPEAITKLRALSLDDLEQEIVDLEEEGIEVISFEDDDYPLNIKVIRDAPPILFGRGELFDTDSQALAIVGTRSPSDEAREFALLLGYEMAERGLTIVSGLALGIDTAAHEGALQASSGRTLAVLGSGIKRVHPKQNLELAATITGRGALLSEVAPNTSPQGSHLMARDRIVTGLGLATVVVEANLKSGSVNAAGRARRQGRLLLVVPGSPGTDALVAEGGEAIDPQALDLDGLSDLIASETVSGESSQQLSLF
jgi:DNA processing protein